jgi:hypothetical protein
MLTVHQPPQSASYFRMKTSSILLSLTTTPYGFPVPTDSVLTRPLVPQSRGQVSGCSMGPAGWVYASLTGSLLGSQSFPFQCTDLNAAMSSLRQGYRGYMTTCTRPERTRLQSLSTTLFQYVAFKLSRGTKKRGTLRPVNGA